MFRRLFSLEGKNRHLFVACDLRTEPSERTGDEMVVTVEELKRLEEVATAAVDNLKKKCERAMRAIESAKDRIL